MKHGSLFTGLGGFDLAAKWMNWTNIFQCEIDRYCQRLLTQNFPETLLYEDIRKTDFTIWRGYINVLTGGFPCQPFSVAGKRQGRFDSRHLWPQMLRAIREIYPTWIVGENVPGLVNWDGGIVYEEIINELETEGYQTHSFIIPAASLGAPHLRERIFIIGHRQQSNEKAESQSNICQQVINSISEIWPTSNTNSDQRFEGRGYPKRSKKTKGNISKCNSSGIWDTWKDFPSQSAILRANDGIPYRVDRIKALGNAIVPQIAYGIFKAIDLYDAT